jgi:hypothetical protein
MEKQATKTPNCTGKRELRRKSEPPDLPNASPAEENTRPGQAFAGAVGTPCPGRHITHQQRPLGIAACRHGEPTQDFQSNQRTEWYGQGSADCVGHYR